MLTRAAGLFNEMGDAALAADVLSLLDEPDEPR
jgi:hypothetical protein